MDSKQTEADELLTKIGQRIRFHIFTCDLHKDSKRFNSIFSIPKLLNCDYCYREPPRQIYKELQNSMYIPYASIIILIRAICKCGTMILRKVLRNIRLNRHLRYKTKLIIYGYSHNTGRTRFIICGGKIVRRDLMPCSPFIGYADVKHISAKELDSSQIGRDRNIFRAANVDNAIFLQTHFPTIFDYVLLMDSIYDKIRKMPFVALNELFAGLERRTSFAHTTTWASFYFYNINPALAIIINNYYFTNTQEVRSGSEQDVRRLIRELKIAQIPFILIQDIDRDEVLQIVNYLRQKNFHPLKSFLFFLMSHGEANNVIDTNDGQLDLIEDIVRPIQLNQSLKDAKKVFIITSCRGGIDMEYADRKDLEKIRNANNTYSLDDNTVILRSVPELVLSPRDPEWGTPFMRSFCQNFRHIDHKQDIYFLHNRIEQDLQNEPYYEYLQKCTDLVVGTARCSHCIIYPRINAQEVAQLLLSIRDDFPVLQAENQGKRHLKQRSMFYICGYVKEIDDPSVMSFADIYFSPELDKDKENEEFQGN